MHGRSTPNLRAFLLVALLPFAAAASAADDPWAAERKLFVEAERALARGDRSRFRRLRDRLRDYPLHSYLVYADLRRRLSRASDAEIGSFLDAHAGEPMVERLRRRWLERLARAGRWETFLAHYRPARGTTLRCRYLQALIRTGARDRAFAEVPSVWLVGESQPDECDPVFFAWRDAGGITPELAWGRIQLAMERGRPRLARYLERFLPPQERSLAATWRAVRRDPEAVVTLADDAGDAAIVERVRVYAVERAARRDPDAAVTLWERLRAAHSFSSDALAAVQRRLGLSYAYAQRREALDWLEAVPDASADRHVRAWRVVAAVRHGLWERALDAIARLERHERDDGRWRYWHARALGATGEADRGHALLDELAGERSYYGFLAADRRERPYSFGDRPLDPDPAALDAIRARPPARRARELLHLERDVDARREWWHFVRGLSDEERTVAAKLAQGWDWHAQGILTIARTDHRDDLALRFPVLHRSLVEREAGSRKLDPAWVLAMVRQESAFMTDARSPAGALGLMQVMPATGRTIARALKTRLGSSWKLLEPDTSIRFGTTYLRMMLDRWNGHPALAIAAYNAGPSRVARWLPQDGPLDALVWIENITFTETRKYVRRVLAYTAIYEWRLGGEPTRLVDRLDPVPVR